jgi:uncharacterized protein
LPGAVLGLLAVFTWLPDYRVERRFFISLGQLDTWNVQRGAEWLLFWVGLGAAVLILTLAILPGLIRMLRQRALTPFMGIVAVGLGLGTSIISLTFALAARARAENYLMWRNSVDAGPNDPVFSRTVGFYMTELPFRGDVAGGVRTLLVLAILIGLGFWLASYLSQVAITSYSISDTGEPRVVRLPITMQTIMNLPAGFWAGGALYLAVFYIISSVLTFWYDRPSMLFMGEDVTAGPGARITTIDLNGQLLMIGLHAVVAVALIGLAVSRRAQLKPIGVLVAVPIFVSAAILIVGAVYNYFSIRPNELSAQIQYIERTIEGTREGYGISAINEIPVDRAPAAITEEDLAISPATIENIRVTDPEALLRAIEQLQEVRTYYSMHYPDTDRYMINGEITQVLVSAREVVSSMLPPSIAESFIQRRLQYTHGFGIVVAPAQWSERAGATEPDLLVRDMPLQIAEGFPDITQPRLYMGEQVTDGDWVVVNTGVDEVDFPGAQDVDVPYRYTGPDGVPIGSGLSRLMMVMHLGEVRMWTSNLIEPDSRVIFHRGVLSRLETLAPQIHWDPDPLLFVRDDGSLAYVANGITASNRYPYSETILGDNYQRNSVKAVVNAYTGEVTMYVFDTDDPIIRSLQRAMPALFTTEPLPSDVIDHLQYPGSLFSWQALAYEVYHTTDPGTIYSGTDLWLIDREIVYNWNTNQEVDRPMEPYWVLSEIPGEEDLAYRTILGFSVAGRRPLAGWLTVNNDTYEMTSFKLPRGTQTMGSLQFETLINSSPEISQQLTLWGQQGSRVVPGQTVITPVGEGFLYVEPIYLVGQGTAIPQLVRVIAGTQNRVAWAPTLSGALEELLDAPIAEIPEDGEPVLPPPGVDDPAPTPAASPPVDIDPADPPADLTVLTNLELAILADQLFDQAQNAPGFEERGRALDELGRVIEELQRRAN